MHSVHPMSEDRYNEGRLDGVLWICSYFAFSKDTTDEILAKFLEAERIRMEAGSFVPAKDRKKLRDHFKDYFF